MVRADNAPGQASGRSFDVIAKGWFDSEFIYKGGLFNQVTERSANVD